MPVYPPYIIFLYFTFIMAEKHICSLSFSGKTSTSISNKRWRLMLTKKSLHYLFSFTTLLLPRYRSLVFSEVLRACSLTRLFAIEWSWKKPSRLPVKATPTVSALHRESHYTLREWSPHTLHRYTERWVSFHWWVVHHSLNKTAYRREMCYCQGIHWENVTEERI